ncbi:pyridoxal phosphate-dependent aminotransferase, partial [Streptomyces nojiriensis]
MQRTATEGRGPVRYGPPAPQPGLPVLPELVSVLAAAAGRAAPHAHGGGVGRTVAATPPTRPPAGRPNTPMVAAGPRAPA